ncbi:phage tail sheath C-terminal domain-containing protein [Serratia marcescens]|uniref:phage tail sheath C-terminal domain-containing protein n=1 Tax=Serratia marcescens TaxID=615 RepID=UPI0032046E6B
MLRFPLSPGVHVDEQETVSFGIERSATAVPVFVMAPNQPWWETVQQPVIVRSFGEYESWVRGRTVMRRQGQVFGTDSYASRPAHRKRTPWPAHWPTLSQVVSVNAKESNEIDWGSPLAPALKAFFDNGGSYCYLCPSDKLTVIADMQDVTLLVQAGQPANEVVAAMLFLCQPGSGIFALLDGPVMEGKFASDVLDKYLEEQLSPSECAALYFPWLKADWPLRDGEGMRIRNKDIHPVAPSAVAAGLICRTDRQIGVWKAPANVAVSPGLTPQVRMGDNSQARYTSANFATMSVNMFREFPGRGVQLWGARTLTTSGNAWGYIPVRRTFDMVERDLQQSLGVALFEPNNTATWQQLRASAGSYLHNLMQRGAFAGRTEADSYYVEVGVGSTMSQEEVDAGIARMRIGMAVVSPAEFVVLEFGQYWTRAAVGQGGVPVPPPVEKRFVLAERQLPEFEHPKDATKQRNGACLSVSGDGNSLAISGNTAKDAIYLFSRESAGDAWKQTFASYASIYSGRAVSLNGVGDVFSFGVHAFSGGGTVVVYTNGGEENGGGRYQVSPPTGSNQYGCSIALNRRGDWLAIGAKGQKSERGTNCGAVYVTNDFLQTGNPPPPFKGVCLMLDNPEVNDSLGHAVALSADGHILAASAPGRNDGDGEVTLWSREGEEWIKAQPPLGPDGDKPAGQFGFSLSLNDAGNILAIGSPDEDSHTGAVYLFRRTNDHWERIVRLTVEGLAEGDKFGYRVALSSRGDILVVSSPEAKNDGVKSGAVWWFSYDAIRGWQPQGRLVEPEGAAGNQFGSAIALGNDSNLLAVGASHAPVAQGVTGKVYLYEWL